METPNLPAVVDATDLVSATPTLDALEERAAVHVPRRGRPPGTKNNYVANVRQDLERAVVEYLSVNPHRIKKVIDKLFEDAENGNVKATKLILDKLVANAGGDTAAHGDRSVIFRIENATFAAQGSALPGPVPTIIDAEVVPLPVTDDK